MVIIQQWATFNFTVKWSQNAYFFCFGRRLRWSPLTSRGGTNGFATSSSPGTSRRRLVSITPIHERYISKGLGILASPNDPSIKNVFEWHFAALEIFQFLFFSPCSQFRGLRHAAWVRFAYNRINMALYCHTPWASSAIIIHRWQERRINT